MKTAFIHDHTFKKYGGRFFSDGKLTDRTWKRYLNVSNELVVIAREKEVFCPQDIENLNETTLSEVKFNCIPNITLIDRIFNYKIKGYIESIIKDVDFVVCRLPSFLGSIAFDIAIKHKKKVLVEVVGCPYDAMRNHGSIKGYLIAPFEAYKLRATLSKSSNAIYVTKKFLQYRYPCQGSSISASNVELYPVDSFVEIKDHVKVIKFIGSLNCKYKGLQDLISALALISSSHKGIELHILGGGNQELYKQQALELGLGKQISFHESIKGGVPILNWLKECDIYVQPSHTEGLPRSLIEAMSLGLPCVATNVGGIPELIDDSFLCKPKSPIELADRIKKLLDSYELRIEQSEINKNRAKEYAFDTLQRKRFDFISEIVEK
ncbi:glycosyltransferase [Pseudoalteromonas sp. GW168-MNA-CIBAN-0100]|uniref:glycosyltransferase n=1 Tax=Pseudoalteromonas sp. GW168-MNA-CIBAN-0100 TaxID=3140434 RepID=UPI00332A7B29